MTSSTDVASMPWAFTQHQPLDTDDFIKEAARRGVSLPAPELRALYRSRVVEPFAYVNNRRVGILRRSTTSRGGAEPGSAMWLLSVTGLSVLCSGCACTESWTGCSEHSVLSVLSVRSAVLSVQLVR
jgi:hypothetical protein